ncbi:major capsid protein [Actinomadura decatromicini]|uniref:Phage capsid protein n=1 Tax=Actinomadura decatromicini TaxID=2604572 RepID=A0A5D3FH42_9ACTN|nr:phage capsid protein [Actinomadura decatromicini]TYK47160.1 phage capsid protein [Actinomadura decatromicini]
MAVSLAEAKNNVQDDIDVAVIDEFRKESVVLDSLIFDDVVNPAGGQATMTYGYRRLVTQPTAATRAINAEYTASNVTTQRYTTDLAVMGGSFQVDRVVAKLGPNASGAVSLNLNQKIKATKTKFQDEVINGDIGVDANGFDGLDKALTGSSTEYLPLNNGVATGYINWTDFDTDQRAAFKALDLLDEWLSMLDGTPTLVLGNTKALARVRALARRAGQYTKDPVDDLIGQNGRPITRETYGGVIFADPGNKAGSNSPIIPIETRDTDGAGAGGNITGLTDLYAYRVGEDGFKGLSTMGGQLVQTWLPDFTTSGAVKTGEVELGPIGVALMATKAAAVLRNIKVQ